MDKTTLDGIRERLVPLDHDQAPTEAPFNVAAIRALVAEVDRLRGMLAFVSAARELKEHATLGQPTGTAILAGFAKESDHG